MYKWEEEENIRIGKILREVRLTKKKFPVRKYKQKGSVSDSYVVEKFLSQRELSAEIANFYAQDYDTYVGAKNKYHYIAASTISKYENGTASIPATYISLMKKIYGDFDINP